SRSCGARKRASAPTGSNRHDAARDDSRDQDRADEPDRRPGDAPHGAHGCISIVGAALGPLQGGTVVSVSETGIATVALPAARKKPRLTGGTGARPQWVPTRTSVLTTPPAGIVTLPLPDGVWPSMRTPLPSTSW